MYDTPNIHTIGWIDINSDQFAEIIDTCVGLIYPSCSEGQSGAVVTCMQAGLIPIISYESGIDVQDFGIILNDCSLAEITNTLKHLGRQPENTLREMALGTWEYAREHFTKDVYAKRYRHFIQSILEKHHQNIPAL